MAKRKPLRSGPPLPGDAGNASEDWGAPTSAQLADIAGEAMEGVVQTPEDKAILQQERVELFGATLALKRKKWVTARAASGVEKRWTEDTDQYLGQDASANRVSSMMESAREGYPVMEKGEAKATRSSVVVNITRSKTNAAESRLADMLLPTDDQNWGIKPTPVPALSKALQSHLPLPPDANGNPIQVPHTDAQGNGTAGPDGKPVMRPATERDKAQMEVDAADKACDAMELEIQDQLEECSYNTEARAALHDAAVIGTGILKGPIVTNQARRAWKKLGSAYMMDLVIEKKPASERVNPWYIYPDPACGENIHDGSGLFQVCYMPEKGLRELAKQPGYNKAAILRVLEEGPQDENDVPDNHEQSRRQKMGLTSADKEHYGVWEYWGAFDRADLEASGVKLPPSDEIRQFDGCVILVNKTVIKAFLNPLESGDLPYDFFPWEKSDGQPWGFGIPFMMRTPQRVLNAAWRQTMDNAGLAVGPQIVVKPSIIQPADKQWTISGRKIWWCLDDTADVRTAFQTFEFNMHLADLERLVDMAMKFADEETAVPMLAQGEKGNAPDTVGGMTLLMNSSNVVLRRLVKQFDDAITRPHITRYYEWNMLFNDKEEIKGDFSVDARGSSALLVKDTQNQALLQLGQFMGNPVIGPMVNWDEWFRETLKSNHIDASKILKSAEEIQQALQSAGQAAPAPAVQAAQIRAASAEKIAGLDQQTQLEVEKANIEHMERMEVAQQQAEAALADKEHQTSIAVAMINARLSDSTLQSAERQLLEKLKTNLAGKQMELDTQKELAAASTAVELHKHHNPVMPPPVQVPGRAPVGHAFQQV